MNEETRGGFCGHQNEYEIPVGTMERTRMQIVRRYRSGVREFWSGGMGWFGQSVRDEACEQTVRKLRSSGEIGQDAQLWLFVIINMLFYGFPAAQRRKAALGGWGNNAFYKCRFWKGSVVWRSCKKLRGYVIMRRIHAK